MEEELRKETVKLLREIFEVPAGKPVVVWEIEQGSGEVYKTLIEETRHGKD